MKPTHETDSEQLLTNPEISPIEPVVTQAPNLFLGKLLIWIAVFLSLIGSFLYFVWLGSDLWPGNNIDYRPDNIDYRPDNIAYPSARDRSLLLTTNIYSVFGNLLYVLPLLIVKRAKTFKVWAIVWLVLAGISLIFLPILMPFSIRMYGPLSTVLGLTVTILTMIGSILIIVKTSQACH